MKLIKLIMATLVLLNVSHLYCAERPEVLPDLKGARAWAESKWGTRGLGCFAIKVAGKKIIDSWDIPVQGFQTVRVNDIKSILAQGYGEKFDNHLVIFNQRLYSDHDVINYAELCSAEVKGIFPIVFKPTQEFVQAKSAVTAAEQKLESANQNYKQALNKAAQ